MFCLTRYSWCFLAASSVDNKEMKRCCSKQKYLTGNDVFISIFSSLYNLFHNGICDTLVVRSVHPREKNIDEVHEDMIILILPFVCMVLVFLIKGSMNFAYTSLLKVKCVLCEILPKISYLTLSPRGVLRLFLDLGVSKASS